jgi:hypothetical protein
MNPINRCHNMEQAVLPDRECMCPGAGMEYNENCEMCFPLDDKRPTSETMFLKWGAVVAMFAPAGFALAYTDATVSTIVAIAQMAGVVIGYAWSGRSSGTPMLHLEEPPKPKGGASGVLVIRHAG